MWTNVKNLGLLLVAYGSARTPWVHSTALWDVLLDSIAHRLVNALVGAVGKTLGCVKVKEDLL